MREAIVMRPNTTSGFLFVFCGAEEVDRKELLCRLQDELEAKCSICLQSALEKKENEGNVIQMNMMQSTYSSGPYCSLSFVEWSKCMKAALEEVERALQAGKIVLCEGYVYSCLANCCAPGQWLYDLVGMAVQPDMTFFFGKSGVSADTIQQSCAEPKNVVAIRGYSQEEWYQQVKETIERVMKNDRK